ncbi:MAG TPA: sulfotransferase family 2 domain-containing protein [Kiloniellaceae bacterium]|nr:sulfotransferase family 2 domain-containing protein [Kiloniellaceae bacterium]
MQSDAIDFAEHPLVFTHIPKTAGTTINHVLRDDFAGRNLLHIQRVEPEILDAGLADRSIHAFGGHLTYVNLSAAFAEKGRRPLYVTVLRDPIDRILSAYSYAKVGPPQRRWHDLANQHDINGFIATMAESHEHFLEGRQCRFVGAVRGADADQALASLQNNYAVVGLQEDMDGFMDRLEDCLRMSLTRYRPRNRSKARTTAEALDGNSLRILERTTEQDRKLYEAVSAWLKG